MSEVRVRRATEADGAAFIALVGGLAAYEHLPPPDKAGEARLLRDAFGPQPRFDLLIAEIDDRAVGYAVVFETYSTFLARPKLYLEDLFVSIDARGAGVGLALMRAVARECLDRGCARLEWVVLDWNAPALDFYRRLGAAHEHEWLIYRLAAADLVTLSAEQKK